MLSDRLKHCTLCPRNCGIDRTKGEKGWCGLDDKIYISSICIHKGEEPPVSGPHGICNVFFAHCNLQCVYCQNYQISDNKFAADRYEMTLEAAVNKIIDILDKGIQVLGFVSPSHQIPQMLSIIEELHKRSYKPTIVYNSNGYDRVETLKELESIVDVYLPDFKYSDPVLSKELSDAPDYPEIAYKAIKEMYRQKGSLLITNDSGYAESGLIIRHLILPGEVENSLAVLKTIAEEISPKINISLMSQYWAPKKFDREALNHKIKEADYLRVTEEMNRLGLDNGWVQEFDSHNNYRPDFNKIHPFED
ncbi:MAG TPA: radical SAM protein [Clostridiales bacterium]|nr:radical SAM protein [Clostridiales bacterium]HQP69341.1 radical SAM protein [Clostridiales bacterium]